MRAVLVTGASTGIGRATAARLAQAGWSVFAGVRRDADAEAVRGLEGAVHPLRLDVTDADGVRAALDEVAAAVGAGGLAGLVNNAGTVVSAPTELLPLSDLREQLEVNLIGVLCVTQAALPLLRAARGRIVNVGSISGRVAFPFEGAYNASKFALRGLGDTLRLELAPDGLDVCLIEPGPVATPIWERLLARWQEIRARLPEAGLALYRERLAAWEGEVRACAGRGVPPDDVARAIERALTARRPRTRYVVGRGAGRWDLLSRLAPARLLDRVILR